MKTKPIKPLPLRRSINIDEETWYFESRSTLDIIHWFKSQEKNVCAHFKIPWKAIIESAKRCRPEEFTKRSLEMQIWWRDHQKKDKERIEKELAHQKTESEKQSALAKLTDYERKLLGL